MSNSYLSAGFRTAVLALLSAGTAYIPKRPVTPAYAGALTINWVSADIAYLTLTGNCTITNSGAVDGQGVLLYVTQDGTGSRSISFASGTAFNTTIPSITLSTAAGATDMIQLIYRASTGKYNIVSFVQGVS
jgi:hypothetical protein